MFKSQAAAMSKKKDAKYDEYRKLEAEKMALEKLMSDKEA